MAAAESYYEAEGRTWERAAFIRARVAAGDKALGSYFLDAIRPFVWRRGLDFGAIGEIRDLSRRIDDLEPQLNRHGYDVKSLADQFDARPAEIKHLLRGSLDPARSRELMDEMRAAGLPL